jgi:hypothetical protein
MELDNDGTEVWALIFNGSVPGPMMLCTKTTMSRAKKVIVGVFLLADLEPFEILDNRHHTSLDYLFG